jgi:hypothetical protein
VGRPEVPRAPFPALLATVTHSPRPASPPDWRLADCTAPGWGASGAAHTLRVGISLSLSLSPFRPPLASGTGAGARGEEGGGRGAGGRGGGFRGETLAPAAAPDTRLLLQCSWAACPRLAGPRCSSHSAGLLLCRLGRCRRGGGLGRMWACHGCDYDWHG